MKTSKSDKKVTGQSEEKTFKHSFNVPQKLDERITRCMGLENLTNLTDFVNSSLSRRCREIEREHGIDAEGKPLKS